MKVERDTTWEQGAFLKKTKQWPRLVDLETSPVPTAFSTSDKLNHLIEKDLNVGWKKFPPTDKLNNDFHQT